MKKLLGILLVLTLTVGTFSGLTLFSLSANATTSGSFFTPGSELYLDFENESDVTTYTGQVEWADANAVAAAGAPTTLPNGKPVGAVAFYNHPSDNDNWNGFAINNTYVVPKGSAEGVINEPGWYVLSAWIYVVARNSGNNGNMNVNMQAGGGSCFIDHMNDSGSGTGKNTQWNTIKPTVTGQWFYHETPFYVGQEFYDLSKSYGANIRFDTFGKCSAYFVDSANLTKISNIGTDYNLVQLFEYKGTNIWNSAALSTFYPGSATYDMKYWNLNTNTIKFWQKMNNSVQKNPMAKPFAVASANYTSTGGTDTINNFNPYSFSNLVGKDNCFGETVSYNLFGIDLTHMSTDAANITTLVKTSLFGNTINKVKFIKKNTNFNNLSASTYVDVLKGALYERAMGYISAYPYTNGMIKATAYPYSGNTFLGWYDAYGRLISTDSVLYTYAEEPIQAKFSKPGHTPYSERDNILDETVSTFDSLEAGSTVSTGTITAGYSFLSNAGGAFNGTIVTDSDTGSNVLQYSPNSTYQSPGWVLEDVIKSISKEMGVKNSFKLYFSISFKETGTTSNGKVTNLSVRTIRSGATHTISSVGVFANSWQTVSGEMTITPDVISQIPDGGFLFCLDLLVANSTLNIDNVIVRVVEEHTLEVKGDAVAINGTATNKAVIGAGTAVTITQTDATKVLTGVKLGDTVYPAVDGVVTFTMPKADVTLELITYDKNLLILEKAEINLLPDDLSNFDALEVGTIVPLGSVGGATNFTVTEDAEKGKVVTYTAPEMYSSAGWNIGDKLRAIDAALGGGKTIRISISADFKTTAARDFSELSFRNTAGVQIVSSNYGYKHVVPSNTWYTLTWVLDVTPELLGNAPFTLCFDRLSKNAVISFDNVVVKYVPAPQNNRVLEVNGDGVLINDTAVSSIMTSAGTTVKISLDENVVPTQVLTGVKLGETVYFAVNGVVEFVMPNCDVALETMVQDRSYTLDKNQITLIAGNGTVIKTVEEAKDILEAPARLGYTVTGYSVNGAEPVATLAEAQAAVNVLIDEANAAGTFIQATVKYVYAKKASDTTIVSINGTKNTVEKLKLYTYVAEATQGGVPFAYWEDANGNVVSYNRILAVYPTNNLYLTAVYKAANEVVKEDYFALTGFTKNADQSISLVSDRNMGASTLVEHGLRLVSSIKQLDAAQAESVLAWGDVLGGTKRYTVWAKSTNPVGTFVASKTNADSNLYWYAAAIYKVEGGADYVISNYKELTPNQVESMLATFDDADSVDQLVSLGMIHDATGTSRTYTSSLVEETDADGNVVNKYFKVTFDAHNSNNYSGPSFGNFKNYFKETGVYTLSFRYKINSLTETEAGTPGLKFIGASSMYSGKTFHEDTTGKYKTEFFSGCNRKVTDTAINAQVYHNFSGQGLDGTQTEDDGWYVVSYSFELKDEDLNTFVGTNWKISFQNISKLAHEICIDDITIVKGTNVNF